MIEVISRKVNEDARVYEITFRADNNEQIKQIRNFMYTLSDQPKTNSELLEVQNEHT